MELDELPPISAGALCIASAGPASPSETSQPLSQAAATGGNPTALVYTFPHAPPHDINTVLDSVAQLWPAFGDLRASASAVRTGRLRNAIATLLAEARVIFFSELLAARDPAALRPPGPTTTPGSAVHSWARYLLTHGTPLLQNTWAWSAAQCALLAASLLHLLPTTPWRLPAPSATLDPAMWPPVQSAPRPYPALHCIFLHAIRVGCPWQDALRLFATLPDGHLSEDGRVFATADYFHAPFTPLRPIHLCTADDPEALTLLFHGESIVAVASSAPLRPTSSIACVGSARPMVLSSRGHSFPTNFLPDFIRLKLGPTGVPIVPSRYVTSVVAAAHEWHARVGPLDAITAAVVGGRLIMSKPRFPLRHSRLRNHASWERNEAAKIALGPKFADWIVQGIVEMIPRNCPLPLFIEPLGAVDKATDPLWRLILDARYSNEFQDAWGVWYSSAAALAALLDACDIMFAEDLEDAYHLSAFAGCTGRLHWAPVLTFIEDGSMAWRWRLVLGCTPQTCLGFCDKAMSGFEIGGFIGRFAAAHFGQRNAGSPLNALMRSILRFLARRETPRPARRPATRRACPATPEEPALPTPFMHNPPHSAPPPTPTPATVTPEPTPAAALPKLARGLGPLALHSAVWVDDTVFVTKTPKHPTCAGLDGDCPTCLQTRVVAARSQSYWQFLAGKLGVGLSQGKRQKASQRVTYTGLVLDTFLRTISMPPDKKLKLALFLESFFGRGKRHSPLWPNSGAGSSITRSASPSHFHSQPSSPPSWVTKISRTTTA